MYDYDKVKAATALLLEGLGEDLNDDNIKETPDRVAKMYKKILAGKDEDPKQHLKVFESNADEMVTLYDIPFYSFCSHHILPFYGKLSIAYIPDGKVIGISKLVRIARVFAKRLQLQEDLTKEIADFLEKELSPYGVAVSISAAHMCMQFRGVVAPGSKMRTTVLRGLFLNPEDNKDPKSEFLNTITDV